MFIKVRCRNLTNSITCSIPDELTPFGRMMALLQWYLTSFHVGRTDSTAKKPYNPIIGETFHCSWRVQNINSIFKAHRNLKPKSAHETINLGPQFGSKYTTEDIATDTNVHPTSDGHISGLSPKLPDYSETGRPVVDSIAEGNFTETHMRTYMKTAMSNNANLVSPEVVKDVTVNSDVVTDAASESVEITYTAEQVSHHPPGILLQNKET
jgi:hypothetical protein